MSSLGGGGCPVGHRVGGDVCSSRSSGWGWVFAAVHFERGEDSSTVWPTAELRPLRKQLTVFTTSKDSACLL